MPLAGLQTKDIGKIKLLLTTRCQLACPYCFVPDTGRDMPWALAQRGIDCLLRSPGQDKLLCFFGGEPLLHWSLLEFAAGYARRQARLMGKRLTLSAITNGLLVNARTLEVLAGTGTRLGISMAGAPEAHDRARYFKGGGGSYWHARRGLEAALKRLGPEKVGVSLCLLPETASQLMENYRHLSSLGARYFNFEVIVGGSVWNPARVKAFLGEARLFALDLLARVRSRDFVYFNPLNWELARGRLTRSRRGCCPFWADLSVYPDGDMLFSHSARNAPESRRYVVGNLKDRRLRAYQNCSYSAADPSCRACLANYLKGCASDPGAGLVHRALEGLTLTLAELVGRKAAAQDPDFSAYLKAVQSEEALF
ncbi:MAG: radical SAM protein [Elusimicrobia bacterium]|nr:radical SAM protein [Elusimicrobiota bacterium]